MYITSALITISILASHNNAIFA